jgi:hypothetical protein
MSFVKRRIEVTFTLANDPASNEPKTFTESGTNTVTVKGLRVSATIVKAGGPAMATMQMQIYGLTLSLMNQLSTLGVVIQLVPRNVVTVTAGDDETGLATVFVGNITEAWADFQSAPDVPFHVNAHTLSAAAVIPASPSSFAGSTDVTTIMSGLATQMGLSFENNGVTATLANPYFYGSARDQALACVRAAGISWNGGDNGVLAIWPRNGARGGAVPLVSPQTGMIGYPSFTAYGIALKTVFHRSIGFGAKIRVESSLKPACRTWAVYDLGHRLESLVIGGAWESIIKAYDPNFPAPVPK